MRYMRYKMTIIFCAVIILVNGYSLFRLDDMSSMVMLVFFVNLVIVGLIGRQIDRYFFIKKELGTTKLSLIQYSYGLDSTMDGVGITNEKGEFVYVNKSHCRLYGYSRKELLQSNWAICYKKESLEKLYSVAAMYFERDGDWRGEIEGVRKDGTTFPQEIVLSRIKDSKKTFCIVRDLTEQKHTEAQIKRMALTNELTNLPNRRSLLLDFDQIVEKANNLYVLFADLDHFKTTNDTLGHEIGDRVLEHVANRLAAFQNKYTSVFHMGGDEFTILLYNVDRNAADQLASRLVKEIAKPFYVSENEISITMSIGISCYPEDDVEKEELLKLADHAMYYAKSGKNGYEFINAEIKEFLERKSFIEVELKKAIRNQELFLHYQPKLDLQRNKLVGAEALIRWEHPRLGRISPMEFIPIAEETGLIVDIGKWVIKEAIFQTRQWEAEGFPIQISVNVSKRQLKNDSELVNYIQSCIEKYNLKPENLELEITESVMENYEDIIPVLNQLKSIGLTISIDDFGTGFSSLSLLKHLPIDTLKIDQSFIKELETNQTDLAIVKSIIDIGRNLDLMIIAEGIETVDQLNILKDLNCTLGQGYYISYPLPPNQLKEKFVTGE